MVYWSEIFKELVNIDDLQFILNVDGMGYDLELEFVDDGIIMLSCPDLEE